MALYHPEFGYYTRASNPIGEAGDYVTSTAISPVFSFALSKLVHEFMSHGGGGTTSIVDIGCGDGRLIREIHCQVTGDARARTSFYGVDRSLSRLADNGADAEVRFVASLDQVPPNESQLVIANELFDALPFARLVQRGEHLHELWVTERDGELDWTEHEAPSEFETYFHERGIELEDGQFADVSLDWATEYGRAVDFVTNGLIVTFDYGYPSAQLFHPRARRYGTAASYSQQRVTRDLLKNPGEQDLTAHINFDDLIRAGEPDGMRTLFFDRQARFLLAIGAAEHELLQPLDDATPASLEEALDLRQRREDARRLILPDGIGEDIRVLVQGRGIALEGWSFQKKLF